MGASISKSKSKSKGKGNGGFDVDRLTNSKSESDELINKLINSLNELITKDDISVETTNLSNELIETLKIMENCTSCEKDNIKKYNFDEFHKLIDKIKSKKEEKKNIIYRLNLKLADIDEE
ncbi:MAG: hypothetical protein QOK71_10570, partial [Nitrososphaeraceae archaeon]|nr:hypothetical protein [Nitrososphaeraceae archaeon]